MIFFPNRTVAFRKDVADCIVKEWRGDAFPLPAAVEESDWDAVDQASLDSFPASDPPFWTLGYRESERRPPASDGAE